MNPLSSLCSPRFATMVALPKVFHPAHISQYQQALDRNGLAHVRVAEYWPETPEKLKPQCYLVDGETAEHLRSLEQSKVIVLGENHMVDAALKLVEHIRVLTRRQLLSEEPSIQWDQLFSDPKTMQQHPQLYKAACQLAFKGQGVLYA